MLPTNLLRQITTPPCQDLHDPIQKSNLVSFSGIHQLWCFSRSLTSVSTLSAASRDLDYKPAWNEHQISLYFLQEHLLVPEPSCGWIPARLVLAAPAGLSGTWPRGTRPLLQNDLCWESLPGWPSRSNSGWNLRLLMFPSATAAQLSHFRTATASTAFLPQVTTYGPPDTTTKPPCYLIRSQS